MCPMKLTKTSLVSAECVEWRDSAQCSSCCKDLLLSFLMGPANTLVGRGRQKKHRKSSDHFIVVQIPYLLMVRALLYSSTFIGVRHSQ